MPDLRLISTALLIAAGVTGCAQTEPETPPSPPGPPVVSTQLVRSAATVTGQPLRLPQGPAEVVATAVEIAPNGTLPVHQHPWSRFVYVERGRIRVVNHDAGVTREVGAGEVLVESVGQWHEARPVGGAGARLIVTDLVPPGASNMVLRNAAAMRH